MSATVGRNKGVVVLNQPPDPDLVSLGGLNVGEYAEHCTTGEVVMGFYGVRASLTNPARAWYPPYDFTRVYRRLKPGTLLQIQIEAAGDDGSK